MSNFPEQWKKEWFTTMWVFLINKEWKEICNYMFLDLDKLDFSLQDIKNTIWDLSHQLTGSIKDNNIKL